MIKVIVAGGRDFTGSANRSFAHSKFEALWYRTGYETIEFVSGGAKGADTVGEEWADLLDLPCKVFKADWQRHGRGAGFIRNAEMADYADVLVAFWDGSSKGTKNMIDVALKKGLEVHVYRYGT